MTAYPCDEFLEERKPHVALCATSVAPFGCEARSVVDDLEARRSVRGRDRDAHVTCVRVPLDVPQSLARGPVEEDIGVLRKPLVPDGERGRAPRMRQDATLRP